MGRSTARRPWPGLLSRSLAAVLGGYLFTYAVTAALARLLPLPPVDALTVASLPAFAFYTAAILWAFLARSAWLAWAAAVLAVPLTLAGFWPRVWEYLA